MKKKVYLLVLFVVVIANFIAQIPYYLHQYHSPPSLVGSVLLLGVLIWFLLGFIWLWQSKTKGYVLMMAFLSVEFVFYLSTQLTQFLSGKGVLLHVIKPDDPILFIVFGLGYVNLVASGFFIIYLIVNRRKSSRPLN